MRLVAREELWLRPSRWYEDARNYELQESWRVSSGGVAGELESRSEEVLG